MSFIPKPHEIYKHFKGDLYQITAIAEHTETGEALVVYQAMYGDFKTYARPLAMFTGRVDRKKYPDAAQDFRFELQGPEAGRQRAESIEESGAGAEPGVPAVQRAEPREPAGQRTETAASVSLAKGGSEELTEAEMALDPMVLEFLDADSYEQRLNILAGLHHRITDEMITTMAIACDVEVDSGETQERYEALKSCLITLERYECQRIR